MERCFVHIKTQINKLQEKIVTTGLFANYQEITFLSTFYVYIKFGIEYLENTDVEWFIRDYYNF